VVAFVLVGVRGSKPGDGLVEHVRSAEVGGDGDPVAGPGVGPYRLLPAHEGRDPLRGLWAAEQLRKQYAFGH
jgi:hypothetical protein